jgi:hypothetical protein
MPAYVTLEEAQAYFSARLFSDAWANAADPDKIKALEMATRAIDRQPIAGRKTDPAQALAFPRYPDIEVPQAVKDACCEEALALLERGNSQRRKLQQEGVTVFSIGGPSGLNEQYRPGAGRGLLSQEARELLRPWLAGSVAIV